MPLTEQAKLRRDQRRILAKGAGVKDAARKDPNASEEEEPYKELEWPLIRKILHWMKPYRRQYAIALFLNMLFTVLEMLGPMFIRQLIDHDIKGDAHFLTS